MVFGVECVLITIEFVSWKLQYYELRIIGQFRGSFIK